MELPHVKSLLDPESGCRTPDSRALEHIPSIRTFFPQRDNCGFF